MVLDDTGLERDAGLGETALKRNAGLDDESLEDAGLGKILIWRMRIWGGMLVWRMLV